MHSANADVQEQKIIRTTIHFSILLSSSPITERTQQLDCYYKIFSTNRSEFEQDESGMTGSNGIQQFPSKYHGKDF